jgi:hypothetical protein
MTPPNLGSDVGAVTDTDRLWAPGSTITIGFRNPNRSLQEVTLTWIQQLSAITNLTFRVVPIGDAQIRIKFQAGGGGGSYVGTECLRFPKERDTMFLGIDGQPPDEQRRVVLHEFGHALGLIHEHQNPAAGIPWDRRKVYQYFKSTYRWTDMQVNTNIFDLSSRNSTQYSAFDPKSIMIYWVPAELTLDGRGFGRNTTLSPTDEKYLCYWYDNPHV